MSLSLYDVAGICLSVNEVSMVYKVLENTVKSPLKSTPRGVEKQVPSYNMLETIKQSLIVISEAMIRRDTIDNLRI